MIAVQDLYLRVQDTLVKNQSGYFSNDEFNRLVNVAQNDLMLFYAPADGQRAHDALRPFITDYQVVASPTIALPGNYRYKLNARCRIGEQVGATAQFNWYQADFLETDEDFDELQSPIRKPSIANRTFAYRITSAGILLFPTFSGLFELSYIRRPFSAIRAVTVDTLNDIEVYDSVNTDDLEWNEEQVNEFHDAICFYMSIQIRESEIVSWLANRQIKTPQ